MARTEEERLREKTIERQFLYEFERDFELAPATSRAVCTSTGSRRRISRRRRRWWFSNRIGP